MSLLHVLCYCCATLVVWLPTASAHTAAAQVKGATDLGGQCDTTAMSLLVVDALTSSVHWATTKLTAGWGRPAYVAMITWDYRSDDGRHPRIYATGGVNTVD